MFESGAMERPESQAAPVKPRIWAARNAVGKSLIVTAVVVSFPV